MEDRLRKLKDDPVLFAKVVLGFNPFPYQEGLLRDQSKRIVSCMGRQTGKSTTIAAKAVWFAVTHPKTNTLIVSATMRQSMLMMDKILGYVDRAHVLKYSIAYRARTRMRFTNGSWIIALPSGRFGNTLRGHTAHLVILDEAAFIPEEVVANVVLPMISTTDGYVWMLSTPWDRSHLFYKAFSDAKGWSVYHLPSRANPLIKPEFLEEQRQLIGEERFMMEYEAEFVDDARSFFSMTLLRSCVSSEAAPCKGFGGYDPGGRQDYASFVVVDGDLRVVHLGFAKGLSYTDCDSWLSDYHREHGLIKVCVDETGVGAPIVEHLREVGLNVEGVVLTERRREEILGYLKILFEQKRLTIPANTALLSHLNCIEYERTRTGGFRFTHRRGTHDDLAYALALAVNAAKGKYGGEVVSIQSC